MFEQTFLTGPARARTGWSMVVSLTGQAALVGVGLLVPLFNPELLPLAMAPWDVKIAPPPGRPAPPPPAAEMAPRPRAKAAPSLLRASALLAPPRIPSKIELIIDEPESQTAASGPYVPGMRGDGGVPGAMTPSVVSMAPPPPLAPTKAKAAEAESKAPVRIRQGGSVQHGKLIHEVRPKYPPLAIQTRIQGTVRFSAVISTQGTILNLQFLDGHPMLAPAAAEAIRQWRYRPTLLNGDPVEVATVIEVNFTLNR